MARLNRLVVAGLAHHVILRSVAAEHPFENAEDSDLFLQALRRSSVEHGVAVHAYALIDHEVQLMLTPPADDSLGRMLQALSRFYVPAFNRRHMRTGALWQGRFRAAPVGGAEHLLICMRYLEQAPARHGWVGASLADFAWSSAAHHAGRKADSLLAAVPAESSYWQLGNTPFERDAAYLALLDQSMSSAQIDAVRSGAPKGWALGSGEFLARLGSETDRRLVANARGRPKRVDRG